MTSDPSDPVTPAVPKSMTFTPSLEEFKDFGRYLDFMEAQGAAAAGIARVIPPPGWRARRCYDDLEQRAVPEVEQQVVSGRSGIFTQFNIRKKPISFAQFRESARRQRPPRCHSNRQLERKFWKNLMANPLPLHGSHRHASLYDPDVLVWNPGRLPPLLDSVAVETLTSPRLDYGMWRSSLPWTTEDLDLYGIHFLHLGESTSWYAVPPEYGKKLEHLAKGFFPGNAQSCDAFLRHKMTLMSPAVLHKYGVPYQKVVQEAGQFVVTFPFCYRANFNHGLNLAESSRFATPRWIQHGRSTKLCRCQPDPLPVAIVALLRKLQPERYKSGNAERDGNAEWDSNGNVERDGNAEWDGNAERDGSAEQGGNAEQDGNAERDVTTATEDVAPNEQQEENAPRTPREKGEEPEEAPPPPLADVLTVHSYAKGDYQPEGAGPEGEGAGPQQPMEEPLHSDRLDDRAPPLACLAPLPEVEPPWPPGGKAVAPLWQNRPPDPAKERDFNRRAGSRCTVCTLFSAGPAPPGPGHAPLVPEACFAVTTEEESQNYRPSPHHHGNSPLVTCSGCLVTVHASCYGVSPSSVPPDWKCSRCTANALTEDCCLCALRGGALQRTTDNKWVHVLCAIAVLEARFVDVAERRPVDLSRIPLQRFKLKCFHCKKRLKKSPGCCVQCSHGRCPTAFHPTCALLAGVLLVPDDWPFLVHVTCCRHRGPAPMQRDRASLPDLVPGQKVICKHKNGRFYQSDVLQAQTETFYEVDFHDGSFSENLFPQDIVSRDCQTLGPPLPGDDVQVRWTDGIVYGAKFVSAHITKTYLVEFEDGSQLTAKRDDVYSLDEELPKRVKSRLSSASDMRFDGIFQDPEIVRQSKRQRVLNSRYRGDYVEPVVYRAIME